MNPMLLTHLLLIMLMLMMMIMMIMMMMMSLSTDHQDGSVVTVPVSLSGKPGSDCCNVAAVLLAACRVPGPG